MYNVTLTRSFPVLFSGEAKIITYSEYVFEVLGIEHKKRLRHIVICGLPVSTMVLHYIIKGTIFVKTYWI